MGAGEGWMCASHSEGAAGGWIGKGGRLRVNREASENSGKN